MSERPLRVDYGQVLDFLSETEIYGLQDDVNQCHRALWDGTGKGSGFLGWVDLPERVSEEEISRIEKAADAICRDVDVLVVVGIGGSYLGSRAVIEALSSPFYNLLSSEERKTPQILFAGHHMDSGYHNELMAYLKGKSYAINVISKSGTTTEPALAFRLLKKDLEEIVGKDIARKRIYATTDSQKGALKSLADSEGYESFVIPDDVGGRYSVLTPVGLLPIAVSGIDVRKLLAGAKDMRKLCESPELKGNPAYFYAACRKLLYDKGKKIEILANYVPALQYVGEWWKQLYGESEGKDGMGIFPATCNFSSDLHSMGQWIQDGERSIFETVIHIEKAEGDLLIEKDPDDLDGLNFVSGRGYNHINTQAMTGTTLAHVDGGVPCITLRLGGLDAYHLGSIIYFFELACGMSGYLLGVNPFDQPGVEAYKRNMFALIEKPGFEAEREALQKKISAAGGSKIV
ncbi:MAG: glucose-6-phosphate isomerase [Spirochaetota bacterium]|nr:glucose-6-phosphate isomerase [Spirochaetota bacterium]